MTMLLRCPGRFTVSRFVRGAVFALVAVLFREPMLRFFGAQGEALELASTFVLISMPALPLMAVATVEPTCESWFNGS